MAGPSPVFLEVLDNSEVTIHFDVVVAAAAADRKSRKVHPGHMVLILVSTGDVGPQS